MSEALDRLRAEWDAAAEVVRQAQAEEAAAVQRRRAAEEADGRAHRAWLQQQHDEMVEALFAAERAAGWVVTVERRHWARDGGTRVEARRVVREEGFKHPRIEARRQDVFYSATKRRWLYGLDGEDSLRATRAELVKLRAAGWDGVIHDREVADEL